jgi:hypothetical protein
MRYLRQRGRVRYSVRSCWRRESERWNEEAPLRDSSPRTAPGTAAGRRHSNRTLNCTQNGVTARANTAPLPLVGQIPAQALNVGGCGKRDLFVNMPQPCVATCCSKSTRAFSQRSSVSIMTVRSVLYSTCDGGPSYWTNRVTASEYSRAARANCSASLRRLLQEDMGILVLILAQYQY